MLCHRGLANLCLLSALTDLAFAPALSTVKHVEGMKSLMTIVSKNMTELVRALWERRSSPHKPHARLQV